MIKRQIPLFWKFSFSIIIIVSFFGTINLYFINYTAYKSFEDELNRHGFVTGRNLAKQSVDFILYEDLISLNKTVTELQKIDSSIAYIFITNSNNQVLAHSFDDFVPAELINLESKNYKNERIAQFSEKGTKQGIHDYLIPILNGELGSVRLGLYENNFYKNYKSTLRMFFIVVVLFLILGLFGAFIFSYVITTPIKKIIKVSEQIKIDKTYATFSFPIIKIENKSILYFPDELNLLTGKFNQMIIRLHDALKELSLAQKSLIQTEKMSSVGILSAGIAHEINNPIAGIKNCLRRIENSPDNIEQQKKYIDLMNDAVGKIELVVSGLLDFTGKHNFVFNQLDFVEVVENVLLLSSYQLEKSRISVIKNYAQKSFVVSGSKNHLEQVVLNLLINSFDAINERKENEPDLLGEIQLTLDYKDNFLVFSLKDNGIGLPAEKMKYLFDPFFTNKKTKKGTGLGLSVTYNILEQHNGKIEANRNAKSGMNFTVYLPSEK